VKIGFVAIVTIAALIWGWNFLKGINIFKSTDTYYAVYSDVQGLIESGVVFLNGYKVGNVGAIRFDKDNIDRIVVEINLEEKVKLPVNTILLIKSAGLVSGIKDMKLIPGEGPGFHEPGDTLMGAMEKDLLAIIEPIKDKANVVLSQLDSTLAAVNDIMDNSTRQHLKSTLADLSSSMNDLSKSLESGGSLNTSFENLSSVTGNLKNNNENLTQSLKNIASISDSLQEADIKTVIGKADQTFEKLNLALGKIQRGEGTAGKLIANDSVYNNLNDALFSLDSLLIDLKDHTKRYVHFSVFGKKDK